VIVRAESRFTRSAPLGIKGASKIQERLLDEGKTADGTIIPYKRSQWRDGGVCDESIINQAHTHPEGMPLPNEALALVLLTSAVTFICSIDRAAMSVAILPMSEAFKWDDGVKGAVSAAFFAGYMITNVCGGFLATRFSAKGVLAIGVMLWSLFTIATPAAAASGSLPELLAVRSMMGVGEGVSYPSIQNLVRQTIPGNARSRALAFIYSGHQLGTVASYVTAPVLISQLGWQSVFFAFGSLGFVWLLSWTPFAQSSTSYKKKSLQSRLKGAYMLLRSKWRYAVGSARKPSMINKTSPAEEPSALSSPLRFQDVPWREFARARPFWAIVAAQVTVGIGSCLSFSWLPTFYSQVYNVDVGHSAAFCIVPFIATIVATNAAGWIADALVNNEILSKTHTRKLMQLIASLGPALCLMRLSLTASLKLGPGEEIDNSLWDAMTMVTAWLALGGFSAAGYGSNHQDISSRWAGVLFGLSNGIASIAGSASIYVTGMILHETHDWGLIFAAAAGTYVVGAGVYCAWASCDEQFEDGSGITTEDASRM
jgi:ACS family sodium-dependent inorganic phosphate cotransporter